MKTVVTLLVLGALLAPTASAWDPFPTCIRDCSPVPPLHCIDALPWSYLCSGDVIGFLNYYLAPLGRLIALP